MLLFVEIFLVRTDDPNLSEGLAEAAMRRPEDALDALFLMKGDRRAEILSHPSLITSDTQPATIEIGRKVPPSPVQETSLSLVVTQDDRAGADLVIDMALPEEGQRLTWSAYLPPEEDLAVFTPEEGLLAVVVKRRLTSERSLEPLLLERRDRERRLSEMLGQSRRLRREVDALLSM